MRVECPKCKHRFDVPHGKVLEEATRLRPGHIAKLQKEYDKAVAKHGADSVVAGRLGKMLSDETQKQGPG